MLSIAGGKNVFADVSRESVQPSIETMLARAPDVILEVRAAGLIEKNDGSRNLTRGQLLVVRARRQEPSRAPADRRLPRRSRPAAGDGH